MRNVARIALFASAAVGATAVWAQQDMSEVEITAQEVAPGIAVLFGNGGNIGVAYGEDGTVLVDDQFAELSGKIQQAVADLGASPTRFLVNTHYHFDHAGGNENFGNAGATIVAHDNVRKRLADGSNVLGNVTPPAPKAALPVVTYDKGMSFHLNGDVIDVMFLGGGHTDGDSVVRWRNANVVHMGDMFMHNAGWPFIDVGSGGNVEHLLNSLGQVIAMTDAETVIIPGHGEIATRSDLMAFRTMVQTGVDRVKALKDGGSTLEQALAARPVEGLRNVDGGFIADDAFVTAVWQSLEAHNR
ncbi:MBL fold metallo-hydrolase [Alteraurantiacibacter aquimixticola]|uniref:MBL fold metallo-hydrolase n=1 Tax=Alteraurantiacibacter aquimixticola TaxID=2489173 RepID=A0A4T3F5H0_9SPHN|nr:MBL fold metallo-hydrolase [Alteraurantiacibacter aquimixticola]TIX50076.1 MBL fold metallo-hydrolase [Alteraurantiacibacter aquimixticola]